MGLGHKKTAPHSPSQSVCSLSWPWTCKRCAASPWDVIVCPLRCVMSLNDHFKQFSRPPSVSQKGKAKASLETTAAGMIFTWYLDCIHQVPGVQSTLYGAFPPSSGLSLGFCQVRYYSLARVLQGRCLVIATHLHQVLQADGPCISDISSYCNLGSLKGISITYRAFLYACPSQWHGKNEKLFRHVQLW